GLVLAITISLLAELRQCTPPGSITTGNSYVHGRGNSHRKSCCRTGVIGTSMPSAFATAPEYAPAAITYIDPGSSFRTSPETYVAPSCSALPRNARSVARGST